MSTGEKTKLAIVHIGFLIFFISYCIFAIEQWVNVSQSIDLVAYLDIGDAYWRGDFVGAINHYWSPLYSWILGAVIAVVKPDISTEMMVVRYTNFAVMMCLYGAFVFYATTLWRAMSEKWLTEPANAWLSKTLYWIFMYSLFCFSALCFGGCEKDGPDNVAAVFVLLASTAFLKIKFGNRSLANLFFMGVALGIGYFAKAIILPVSLFYYVASWWEMRKERAVWKNLATAAGAEIVLVLPYIVMLSVTFGHPTFSDVSRVLPLFSETQDDQQVHFQFPELKHRSKIIFTNPDVFEFAEPITATYAPWYNPAYWLEGVVIKNPIAIAVKHFVDNISFFFTEIFSYLLVASAVASLIMRRFCFSLKGLANALTVCAPALVAIGAYSVSANLNGHMMERYFVAWMILVYSSVVIALLTPTVSQFKPRDAVGKRILLLSIAVSLMSITIAFLFYHKHTKDEYSIPFDTLTALKTRELGLKPGDKVAQIGFRRYYWARLARLRIVADIFDVKGFWAMDPQRREQLVDILRQNGVKAIIQTWAIDTPLPEPGPGWVKVPQTNARIYIIPPASPPDGVAPGPPAGASPTPPAERVGGS